MQSLINDFPIAQFEEFVFCPINDSLVTKDYEHLQNKLNDLASQRKRTLVETDYAYAISNATTRMLDKKTARSAKDFCGSFYKSAIAAIGDKSTADALWLFACELVVSLLSVDCDAYKFCASELQKHKATDWKATLRTDLEALCQ